MVLILCTLFVVFYNAGLKVGGAATRYDVEPTYNDSTGMYSIPYVNRGGTYYAINVTKKATSGKITARYWVGHNSSKKDMVGTQLMYDPKKMTLGGFEEPCSTCHGTPMENYYINFRWIKMDYGRSNCSGFRFRFNRISIYFK